MSGLGKLLIFVGLIIIAFGLLMIVVGRLAPGREWLLPGDIVFRRGNFTFYFPIVTSIVISIILTLILYLVVTRR